MSHIFPRNSRQSLPTVAKGDGCYLIDTDGKRYFDGSGGAAVSCLGHSDRAVTDAIKAQMDKVAFAHTGFFTSEPAEQLADLLVAHAPRAMLDLTALAFWTDMTRVSTLMMAHTESRSTSSTR